MEDAVQARLELLRAEFETGSRRLAELETQHGQLTETMLRIGGAIQVLEELTGQRPLPDDSPANGSEAVGRAKEEVASSSAER